jgi:hypothetical protein
MGREQFKPIYLTFMTTLKHNFKNKKSQMNSSVFLHFSVGDNSAPFPFVMELWDTVTNDITEVPHPPGFETSRFFRPVLATFDDNSVILAAADVFNDGNPTGYLLDKTWQYKVCESYMQVETAASSDFF